MYVNIYLAKDLYTQYIKNHTTPQNYKIQKKMDNRLGHATKEDIYE